MLKFCSRGDHLVEAVDFPRQSSAKDGLHSWCKACCNEANRIKYQNNVERHRLRKRKYREENPEIVSASIMRSIAKHKMRAMVSAARTRAREYNWSFDLTDYLPQLEARLDRGFCEMTGLPFDRENAKGWNVPSLDRIDSGKGYLYSNVRIISFGMNAALNNWGEDVLETMVLAWLARRDRAEVA